MHSGLCCGLYRGSLFIKDLTNPNNPLLPVGNAEMTLTQELAEIEQPNYQSLGGTNCSVAYIDSVSLDLVLRCISPENLAIALMGTSGKKTGTTVTGEEHAVNGIHELIPFENVPDKNAPIVVKNEAGSVTYVEGEDYVVLAGGIQIIDDSSIPVDGSLIQVDYSYGDNYFVDAQTVAQKEYYVVLDGYNYGEGGQRQVVMKAWKVKFSPTDSFQIIGGTDFASLNVSGEILRDESKPTGSKFAKFEWGENVVGAY